MSQISFVSHIVLVDLFFDVNFVEFYDGFLQLFVVSEIVLNSIIDVILKLSFLGLLCLDLVLDLFLRHLQAFQFVFQILNNKL